MNVVAAIVSGIVGTLAMSALMAMAPVMGLPKMDIVSMVGSMFGRTNRSLGWAIHLMMGVMFALIYASLWSFGIGSPTIGAAAVFGAAHWFFAGMGMSMVPILHAGIRSGQMAAPGLWMMNRGGFLSFVGGLMGHVVFAITVALVYNLF
jgi:hypothetical protein